MRSIEFSQRSPVRRPHLSYAVATALLATALLAGDVSAQATTPPARRQPGGGMANTPRYDLNTVVTLNGTLTALDTVASMSGFTGRGVHAMLKTGNETFPLHLGPVEYLTQQRVHLVKGDAVQVTGSRIVLQTVPTILAATVLKGGDTLTLRDAGGMPLWRGLRRAAR